MPAQEGELMTRHFAQCARMGKTGFAAGLAVLLNKEIFGKGLNEVTFQFPFVRDARLELSALPNFVELRNLIFNSFLSVPVSY